MGEVPEQCTRLWSRLSQAEVGAAIVLGYTRDEWDAEATEGGGGGGARKAACPARALAAALALLSDGARRRRDAAARREHRTP